MRGCWLASEEGFGVVGVEGFALGVEGYVLARGGGTLAGVGDALAGRSMRWV